MQPIDVIEKNVSTALFQFILPFSIKAGISHYLSSYILKQNFSSFRLQDLQEEKAYYGNYHVSHQALEEFFLPLTNQILFPASETQKGFHRYTKKLDINAMLITKKISIPFQLHSVDIFMCPFDLGFLTIRIELNNLPLSHTIEFADCLRAMETKPQKSEIEYGGKVFSTIGEILFHDLFPQLTDFMKNETFLNGQTMFVQSLLSLPEEDTIDPVDLYRSGALCGLNDAGEPYVNANNKAYISNYMNGNCYNRWAPSTSCLFDQQCYSCITIEKDIKFRSIAEQFYGPFYYTVIINLFHRTVMLKITDSYAAININQDKKEIEKLIYMINSFTSNYFFTVYPVHTAGQELFKHIKKSFAIDQLYTNTKEILSCLVKYNENTITKKDSLLLLVLTLYTVICGIFSMNLFTHDLEGKIHLSHFKSYNPFEYFAVLIVFSGIIVVLSLGIQSLYQAIQDRKNHKRWVQESVLSEKKR